MKKLKLVILFLSLLIAIPVIATLVFTKDHKIITLKRSVEVAASSQAVFDYIVHTENKAKWLGNPDEKIKRNNKGKDATVGFVRSWEIISPPEKGTETIINIEYGKSIETQIENNLNGEHFSGKQKLSCVAINPNRTTLTWESETNIPLNLLARMAFGFSEMLSKSINDEGAYEDGIQSALEKEGVYVDMDVNLQKLTQQIELKNN